MEQFGAGDIVPRQKGGRHPAGRRVPPVVGEGVLFARPGDKIDGGVSIRVFHDEPGVNAFARPKLEKALTKLVIPETGEIAHLASGPAGGHGEIGGVAAPPRDEALRLGEKHLPPER